MSLSQVLVEGAARAAQLVPLLFALNAPAPAAAQLPRNVPAAAPTIAPFAPAADEAPTLTLTAHHIDVQVKGNHAHVRSLLTYRNESATTVSTSFAFPFPALIAQGDSWRALGDASLEAFGDCAGDESPADAEFAEVGETVPPRVDIGYVTVAPGEEIRLETHRAMSLAQSDGGYRLALPLPADRSAPYSPQFSADVIVDAKGSSSETPTVTRLNSPTHPGSAEGIGGAVAQFAVGGRAYSGTQFVLDLAFGGAQPARVAVWGGEAHPR